MVVVEKSVEVLLARLTPLRNPGEYLNIGDQIVMLTDLNVFAFGLPGAVGRGEYKAFIELEAGDVVQYLGIDYHAREGGVLIPVPLHRFMLIRYNEYEEPVETIFYMKNVETLLKWSKQVGE